MQRLEKLKRKVSELYETKNPNRANRADWADWLYENHVFLVAEKSQELANRFDANPELAYAAGLLHDVADAVMKRFDPTHEEKSLEMARTLLQESGYSDEEIRIVVDDAIRFHGSHADLKPKTMVGRVMKTADAIVHMTPPYYDRCITALQDVGKTTEEIKAWALPKHERDYQNKISFDEVRNEMYDSYMALKTKLETI